MHTPVVWSPDTRLHEPRYEVWAGVALPGTELPSRVDAVLAALDGRPQVLAGPAGAADAVLREVHDPALLDFLASASERWAEGGYAEEVGQDRVVPYMFPTPALTAGMPPARTAVRVHADVGRFAYDTCTLVGPGTWEAARSAADCAAVAARLVAEGERSAYALCRPPGHHATRTGFGGSCYLNNAAVAAQQLRAAGHQRVGIVDLDAHHGNGTAQIFYDRADVSYASVHVDPGAGWFPHVYGFADETGTGAGEGATHNLPLPPGSGDEPWVAAVAALLDWTADTGCTAVVVSLGVDAAVDDPESPLAVTVDGYREAGRRTAELGLPTVVVQEGGYHLPTLGGLVAAYLGGLDR